MKAGLDSLSLILFIIEARGAAATERTLNVAVFRESNSHVA